MGNVPNIMVAIDGSKEGLGFCQGVHLLLRNDAKFTIAHVDDTLGLKCIYLMLKFTNNSKVTLKV